ncbi:MAG: AAA family ATPase [Acidimicrobiales bacterium]
MTELVPLDPPADSGFVAHDLLAVGDEPAVRPSTWGLFYPRAVSCISGEPGLGKTWLAVAAVRHVLAEGGSALVLDYEDSARTWAARLRELGAGPDDLASVVYLRGAGAPTESDLGWLPRLAGVFSPLVVIDSVAEAMAAAGLDENDAGDVTLFHQRVTRPLADAGGTVLLLDHVVKDQGGRGRWARGSGAKLAAVTGAAFSFEIDEAFSRARSGVGRLVVAKDRHGVVGPVGDTAAEVRFLVAGGSLHAIQVDRLEAFDELSVPRIVGRQPVDDPEAAW